MIAGKSYTPADHKPVLLQEVVTAIAPRDGETYVDGTLGAGGYSRAVLNSADCRVIAFDRDPSAIAGAREWAAEYGDRLILIEAPFSDMPAFLEARTFGPVNGVMLDIGVSSMQLDEANRGFSFMHDGPLSMRMDQKSPDAGDLVNQATERDLAAIFRIYGEEKHAAALARAIIRARETGPIETTVALAEIVADATPAYLRRPKKEGGGGNRRHAGADARNIGAPTSGKTRSIHPATRVFQALRIYVNDELGELARALLSIEDCLSPDGRLAVVTFHSLEDRIVKHFLAERSVDPATRGSRHAPPVETQLPSFVLTQSKPILPSEDECDRNPRARSAKLRYALRSTAPPRGGNPHDLYKKPRLSKDYLKQSSETSLHEGVHNPVR
ncbi:MAG: 16S rRNA (cytosine(1402)-N(4))-methyltransferase RsmH [Pseudomonadota bacterium]